MSTTLHVSAALLVIAVVAAVFVIVYPFILGAIAHRRLAVGWRYFWFGTLVFLVFQLLTRLPLLAVLNSTVLASLLRTSIAFTWFWLVVEAVTARPGRFSDNCPATGVWFGNSDSIGR